MSACIADTHALLWPALNDPRLSPAAKAAMQNAAPTGNRVFVSTISIVESIYLTEKGRFPQSLLVQIVNAFNDLLRKLKTITLDCEAHP